MVDMGCVGEGLSCTEQQVSICAKDSSGPYDYAMTWASSSTCRQASSSSDYAVDVYPHLRLRCGARRSRAGRDMRYAPHRRRACTPRHGYERSHAKGVENTLRLMEKYVEKA